MSFTVVEQCVPRLNRSELAVPGSSPQFFEKADKVSIDVSRAHFWDITAVSALDKVVVKFRREGTEVEVVGLNEASATMVDRFAVHDKPEAVEQLMGH
jgi:SulP family sulfate permease